MARQKRNDPPMFNDYDDEEEVLKWVSINLDKNNMSQDDDGEGIVSPGTQISPELPEIRNK